MLLNVALRLWLPGDAAVRVHWLLPCLELALVLALLLGNPADPDHPTLDRIQVVLAGLLVLAALWATGKLVVDLIEAKGVTQHADQLLATGAVVWLGNILAFSLLYWLTDGGGPVARTRLSTPRDFAFVQQLNPELAPPGWRPVFLDYLHLGFTNATAFSPTDNMPLSHRAKYTMILQSTVSLALVALIIARSVGAFT